MAIKVQLDDVEEGGKWAYIKEIEQLNAGDRRAVRGSVLLAVDMLGRQLLQGDHDDTMKNALLCRIITDWNLTYEIPQGDPSVLDKLSIDQIDRLYKAVDPHLDFLQGKVPNPTERDTDPTKDSSS